ncbi:hypothetical protein Tco_0148945 [Tanacetum coccineum]
MRKSKRNKKRALENFKLYYSDVGPSLSNEKPLTQEEAAREALAIDICKRFSILEEERPVIETMAYSDKYKKILDGIVMDKIKLDGEIKKEEEEAIKHVKGEALQKKEDPRAFIIPIQLEAKIDLNALADTGSDINVMPCRIYAKLGREEVKKVNRGITMLNHSKAEPMGVLKDVLCQITSTFDEVYHQTFRAAKTSLNTEESDSDDEEDNGIQRNSFGAPMYGPKPAKYLNCNDPIDRALALQEGIAKVEMEFSGVGLSGEDDVFVCGCRGRAIVFDNTLTSDTTLPSEPTVCPHNENKMDFRISLDESDDEDYTVIFDDNSFSCKIISINDLKTDSENDNGKNNMPSSPKPTVNYLDDLDCFNDFENEFPAIVYNDGLTSKSDLEIEPPVSSKHINKFKTSLSKYDEEEQNALHFDDSFPLDVIFLDNLKTIKDSDDYFFITQPSRYMAPLPPVDQRHPWLKYQVEGYTKGIIHSYEQRLETIWSRPVNWVHMLDFEGLTPEIRQDLVVRMSDTQMGLDVVEITHGGGLHSEEEMAEPRFGAYWALCHRMIAYSISGRGQAPEKEERGQVVTRELPLIDLNKLGRLNICLRFGDNKGNCVAPDREAARIERIEEEMRDLQHDDVGLRGVVESFTTEQSRVSTWLISCMTQLMDASGHTYHAFDRTLIGSSRMPYQRRLRPRAGDASTSAAPHTDDQPDP